MVLRQTPDDTNILASPPTRASAWMIGEEVHPPLHSLLQVGLMASRHRLQSRNLLPLIIWTTAAAAALTCISHQSSSAFSFGKTSRGLGDLRGKDFQSYPCQISCTLHRHQVARETTNLMPPPPKGLTLSATSLIPHHLPDHSIDQDETSPGDTKPQASSLKLCKYSGGAQGSHMACYSIVQAECHH